MGSLRAATGNLSGAVWHYRAALTQDPTHPHVYPTLHSVTCYDKFHRSQQSSAPPPPPPPPPQVAGGGGARRAGQACATQGSTAVGSTAGRDSEFTCTTVCGALGGF